MLDMTKLAFESDSTRIITLIVDTRAPVFRLPNQKETTATYHNLSHGQNEEKLRQLETADREHLKQLRKLTTTSPPAPRTVGACWTTHGSLRQQSRGREHSRHTNLPILLAGGGFHTANTSPSTASTTGRCAISSSPCCRTSSQTDTFASNTGTPSEIDSSTRDR